MGDTWPRVIRDPIHGLIEFHDNDIDPLLWKLIDTKEFQRLRRIKQLGVSDFVFPGAGHSRFAHSIGVMHIARRMLNYLKLKVDIEQQHELIVLCAALLHDVGHGPFSHAFEKVSELNHEEYTRKIILHEHTEINQVLRDADKELPESIARFFDENPDSENKIPLYLTHIVTSQMDADRFDYLLRDSYSTGANYGKFDLDWIISHLSVNEEKGFLYLDSKSLSAAEQYIFARHHMYNSVYFHKTTRAAEVMLHSLLRRIKDVLQQEEQGFPGAGYEGLPEFLKVAFKDPVSLTLENYLTLDDNVVLASFHACRTCTDDVLKQLGDRFLCRKLFKAQDIPQNVGMKSADFTNAVKEILDRNGLNSEYYFLEDKTVELGYKPYKPVENSPATQIYIDSRETGKQESLESESKAVRTLTEKEVTIRYYYPAEYRNEVKKLAEQYLKGT